MVRRYFSVEETDLASTTFVTRGDRDYLDIDLSFLTKPGPAGVSTTGDVYKKSGGEAVKQAMKTLLLTGLGEKPFNPYFGAGLYDVLFEMNDVAEQESIRLKIESAVKYFEPRVTINDIVINADPDSNEINVTVVFTVLNTSETLEFTTTLNRLR